MLYLKIWRFIPLKTKSGGAVGCRLPDVCVFVGKTLDSVCLCPPPNRKLAKKRKDAIGTTRQEMTHMVNAMDRSYADQSTLHGEDPMAVTFMDSHNYNNRCRFLREAGDLYAFLTFLVTGVWHWYPCDFRFVFSLPPHNTDRSFV